MQFKLQSCTDETNYLSQQGGDIYISVAHLGRKLKLNHFSLYIMDYNFEYKKPQV